MQQQYNTRLVKHIINFFLTLLNCFGLFHKCYQVQIIVLNIINIGLQIWIVLECYQVQME